MKQTKLLDPLQYRMQENNFKKIENVYVVLSSTVLFHVKTQCHRLCGKGAKIYANIIDYLWIQGRI